MRFQNARTNPQWEAFQFTTEEGGNVAAAELESAASELDERTYRQEFQARFENLGAGVVYYAFDRSRNVQPIDYDPVARTQLMIAAHLVWGAAAGFV